jgi:hypothetical protein
MNSGGLEEVDMASEEENMLAEGSGDVVRLLEKKFLQQI